MKKYLIKTDAVGFGRGWVLHCNKAEYPYESKVEFMIREDRDSDSGYSLIVISGYKAGITFQNLPKECLNPEVGVDKNWLIKNWSKWIYPDCPVEEVEIYRNLIGKEN